MAKDTVEILGGQLDGAVLQNAASEATLKELVAAISGNRSSRGGGGGMLGRTPVGMIAGGIVGAVGGAVKGAVNQIGNVTGAAGTFAGMMFKGEGRLSSYTNVLNNQVIKQLPLVGRYLGTVGGAISGTIQEFERWNTTLRTLTGTGATFNNSIIQMMNASVRTYMSLDEFSAFVQKNNKTFVSLGATVTEGATAFSNYSYEVLKASGPARQTLIRMGYTVPVINNQLADFLENNYRGTRQDRINSSRLAESFVSYQTYLHTLTSLTGKQADQLKTEMQDVQNDTAYKLKLSKLDEEERKKVNLALANYTAIYGKEGANMFKALFLGLIPATEAAAYFGMMFPGAVKEMKQTIGVATDGNTKLEAFQKQTVKERARLIKHSAEQLEKFRPLLEAGSIGISELQTLTGVSADVAAYIARTGKDVSKMSLEEIEAMIQKADDELKKQEELTDIIRQFETAMGDFKVGFLDVMTAEGGPLQMFSEAMKGKELPNKIRQFGRDFGYFVTDTLPSVSKFFAKLAGSSGREQLGLSIKKMVAKLFTYMYHYLPKILGISDEVDQGKLTTSLQNINKQYDPLIAGAREKADMEATRLVRPNTGVNQAAQDYSGHPGGGKKGGAIYQDQSGIRNKPISKDLNAILSKAARDAGVDVRITSGGQMSLADYNAAVGVKTRQGDDYLLDGRVVRTGTERHDGGHAADLDVYPAGSNTPLNINSPQMMKFLKAAKARGIKAVGAGEGYMNTGGSGTRLHMGLNMTGGATKWGKKGGDPYAQLGEAGFRDGSLGEMNTLFANFGGSQIEAHDYETIMTPGELAAEMVGAAEFSSAGVNELNNNLSQLLSLMSQRNRLTERISDKMAQGSRNLVSTFS
jgi:hypothetical protein